MLTWNPGALSSLTKTWTIAGSAALLTLAVLCFNYALAGYCREKQILYHGIETLAEHVPYSSSSESGSTVRYVKYSFIKEAEKVSVSGLIEYPFYLYLNNHKDTLIPVKYHASSPGNAMILYSKIYNLTPAHDNGYASYLRALITAIGFLCTALRLFPGKWMVD